MSQNAVWEQLWEKLASEMPEQTCERTGAVYDKEHGCFLLSVLHKQLCLDPKNQQCLCMDTALTEHDLLLAALYMSGAQAVPLAHRWISPLELPTGAMFFRGQHALPTGHLEEAFGTDKESFQHAAQALGGCPLTFADSSYAFSVFPRVPVAVLLWLADDEFPARGRFLVDETIQAHLSLDAILGVCELVTMALLKEAGLCEKQTPAKE